MYRRSQNVLIRKSLGQCIIVTIKLSSFCPGHLGLKSCICVCKYCHRVNTGSTRFHDLSLLESRNDERDHANLPTMSAKNACFIFIFD